MTKFRPLLSSLTIVQVAIIVRDLEASATRQSRLLGNGPWRVYELGPHRIERYENRGSPATGRTLLALNDARPQVELLQPLSGRSIHQEWLDDHGEGLHHVGAIVESVDAVVAAAAGVTSACCRAARDSDRTGAERSPTSTPRPSSA